MTVTDLQSRSCTLRGELKAWEKIFASTHDGRKASREEIKKDVAIAAKYKEYNKIRELVAEGLKPVESPHLRTPTKTRARPLFETPSKRTSAAAEAAGKNAVIQSPIQFATPIVQRSFVGPTPQKDGVVLGLFDLILDHDHTSPSKVYTTTAQRATTDQIDSNAVHSTPRKVSSALDDADSLFQRFSRTPQSAGKRFLLDTFVTPSKRRRVGIEDPLASGHKTKNHLTTPRSTKTHDLEFSTPSFLRRDSQQLSAVTEAVKIGNDENIFTSAHAASPSSSRRWTAPTTRRGKGMARSLSSMIAEMRAQEEERLDEGMDVLREMEEEEEEEDRGARNMRRVPKLLVKDSQAFDDFTTGGDVHRLGPDGAAEDEDNDEDAERLAKEGLGPGGVPLRVWKKKGLKRQTKRVLMRPIIRPTTRATTNPFGIDSQEAETNNDRSATDVVAETQLPQDDDNDHDAAEVDDDFQTGASAGDVSDDEITSTIRKARQHQHHGAATTSLSKITVPGRPDNTDTHAKAVKKVSSTAHANFRRLKIRSSKGAAGASGGGFRGKFGRGRR